MLSTTALRVKRVLVERGPAVATLLLVVGAAALGSAWWIHEHPRTEQVTEETHEQTVRTTVGTVATATGETELYDRGERLRDEPVYLQRSAPRVTLVVRTGRASGANADADLRVEQRVVLELRAAREGAVFWRSNRTLDHTTATGESVVSRATLNMTALRERIAEREQRIGDAGTLAVRLRVRTRYDTGRYSGTLSKSLPVDFGSNWYSIPTASLTQTRRTEVTRTVTVPRDRLTYLAPGAFGAVALLGGLVVGSLWWTRWRHAGDGLTRALEHRAHGEWISEGALDGVEADQPVTVSSIEDLVDVAIDADRRVIYDPARDLYAVIDDAAVYYYRPPNGWDWQESPAEQQEREREGRIR